MGRNQKEEQKSKGAKKVNSGKGKAILQCCENWQHYKIFTALRDFSRLSSSALSVPLLFFWFLNCISEFNLTSSC